MVLRDPYAGYRDYDDPFWVPDPAKHTQWTHWDFSLAEAYRVKENFTDPNSGQPRWLAEDPDVYWEVGYSTSHAGADLRKAQEEVQEKPGVEPYLRNPQKTGGQPFWTVEEWLEQREGDGLPMERGVPEGSRPPSPEELVAMRARRQQAAEGEPIE